MGFHAVDQNNAIDNIEKANQFAFDHAAQNPPGLRPDVFSNYGHMSEFSVDATFQIVLFFLGEFADELPDYFHVQLLLMDVLSRSYCDVLPGGYPVAVEVLVAHIVAFVIA